MLDGSIVCSTRWNSSKRMPVERITLIALQHCTACHRCVSRLCAKCVNVALFALRSWAYPNQPHSCTSIHTFPADKKQCALKQPSAAANQNGAQFLLLVHVFVLYSQRNEFGGKKKHQTTANSYTSDWFAIHSDNGGRLFWVGVCVWVGGWAVRLFVLFTCF